jgi:hypothetical protein
MAKGYVFKSLVPYLVAASVPCVVNLVVSDALAGDWSLQGAVSEKGDLNDNIGLLPVSTGGVIGSITNLNLDLAHKTAVDRFDLIGNVAYQRYFGPGEAEASNGWRPKLTGKYHWAGKSDTLDLVASYLIDDENNFDPLSPTNLNPKAIQQTRFASIAYAHMINQRNTIGTAASFQDITFLGNTYGSTPSSGADVSAFWNYRLTKTIDNKISVGFDPHQIQNSQQTDNIGYWLRDDVTSHFAKDWLLNIGGGPRLGVTTQDDLSSSTFSRTTTHRLGFLANANLTHNFKTGSVSAWASNTFDVGDNGQLERRTGFGITASHHINEQSVVALTAAYRITSTFSAPDETVFLISPTYQYQLARDWSMLAGYRWTSENTVSGTANSNEVFLSVTKAFLVSP